MTSGRKLEEDMQLARHGKKAALSPPTAPAGSGRKDTPCYRSPSNAPGMCASRRYEQGPLVTPGPAGVGRQAFWFCTTLFAARTLPAQPLTIRRLTVCHSSWWRSAMEQEGGRLTFSYLYRAGRRHRLGAISGRSKQLENKEAAAAVL